VGDVLELITEGGLAYLHVTHSHDPIVLDVARVLPGLFASRPTERELEEPVKSAEAYPIQTAARYEPDDYQLVCTIPVPEGFRPPPPLRFLDIAVLPLPKRATVDGVMKVFDEWSPQQREWGFHDIIFAQELRERVLSGWHPRDYVPPEPTVLYRAKSIRLDQVDEIHYLIVPHERLTDVAKAVAAVFPKASLETGDSIGDLTTLRIRLPGARSVWIEKRHRKVQQLAERLNVEYEGFGHQVKTPRTEG
jgi:hypothetical protein